MSMPNEEKQWNMPSAVAFVGALVAGVVMLIMGAAQKDSALTAQGVGALVLAAGIAAPTPWVGDK